MPRRWPRGVSLLSRTLTNAGRRQAGQQHLPGRAPRQVAARSPVTTRSFACARVITAPSPPRSLAVRSGQADAARATTWHPVLRASAPAVLHGSAAGAAAPALTASGPAAARGPRPCSVVTPGRRGWHSGVAAGRPLAQTFRPGRIRQGPSMYEMEGLARPRRARPTSWLAWPTPRAARRGQVPARGDRSPGSSHVPGASPRWFPFPTVKTLLLPPRTPRKGLRPAISCFPLSTKESTGSGQLSAFHGGYPRVYSQPAHRLPGVSRRTPEPLSSHAIG